MPERLALREPSASDSTDAEGGTSWVDRRPGSASVVGVEGTASRFPREPARPREMKLRSRLRFCTLAGGDGGAAAFGGSDGRPASGSTESIDHLDAETFSSKVTGGSRTDELARGDDTDGASETMDGLCATARVEYWLMGDAGVFASSARVRSWGEDVEVDKLSVGRVTFFASLLYPLGASILLLRVGGCAMTVLSRLAHSSSSGWTRTPLRFSTSDSRSSNSDNVDEMDGNVP